MVSKILYAYIVHGFSIESLNSLYYVHSVVKWSYVSSYYMLATIQLNCSHHHFDT